ncbi:MAG: alcohol dehydrogenase catalytic domain-containing protein [Lachnospiraceae bacterium]|nr:alcohol dehydrogenase catalytic domain-containing protein [Lachnospiraceae bacterium]
MKAAKLVEVGRFELAEIPVPEITAPDDVLVQVKCVGICGTDLHIFKEGRADVKMPVIMGHELSGVVLDKGSAVHDLKAGDRVVLDPVFACGECRTCRSGHPNVCPHVRCYGVQMDGGYQEKIVVRRHHLYQFNNDISFEEAALAEPFSIASNILFRAGLQAGEKILILGAGTIGLSVLQVAKMLGAEAVVSDIIPEKLTVAASFGADLTVNSKATPLKNALAADYADGFDVIVDAVGIVPLFVQTFDYAAPCARIMCIGFDGAPAQIPMAAITRKELSVIGSRMNNHRFPEVIDWLNNGKINAKAMITKRCSIDSIQTAFEETLANSTGSIKTIIEVS